jgi:ppGpp synthetase/RelA/SpoT-type nucleotidyltranferase
MALTTQLIDAAVERYLRELDRYEKLSTYIGKVCRSLIEKNSIRGIVQWRAKDPERLKRKLEKYSTTGEHTAEFKDLDSVFHVLKDLAGVRITTYVEDDRVRVIALIQERFSGFGADSQIVPEIKDQPLEYYRATHCMVCLKEEDTTGRYQNLKGLGCEVQVCSQLANVYNEMAHDLRYKPLSGVLSKKENDLLNALALITKVGDTIINQTRDAVEERQRATLDEFSQKRTATKSEVSFRNNSFLNAVADSPLLLGLVRRVQSSRLQGDLPETPAEFYQEMIRLLATGAILGDVSNSVPSPGADDLLATLPGISWRLFNYGADVNHYERYTLIETIERVTNKSQSDAAKLLAKVVECGLLVTSTPQSNKQYFQFAHTTLRDFLAAKHVALQINRDGWNKSEVEMWQSESDRSMVNVSRMIDAHSFMPPWQPIIVFIASLMNTPLDLLQILSDRKKDDIYRHRLGLLCRCYYALNASHQSKVAPSIAAVFEEILRIAKRCERDDAGHRKPWLEWAEMLLSSLAGAERLCSGLLTLDGRYQGWAVSAKVLEMLERALTRGKVTPAVVEKIAQVAVRDEHQWSVNTARLSLRLAEDEHRQILVSRFISILKNPKTSDRVKIRLAEAVAAVEDTTASITAGEMLIGLAQSDSLAFEHSDKAVNGLVTLLGTKLAPIAAPLLVSYLLKPSSRHNYFWLAWRIIGKAESEPDNPWSALFLGITLFADREEDRRLKLWSAQVLSKHTQPYLQDLGLRSLFGMVQEKKSHSWVHAARWLVENGPTELAEKARAALLAEASSRASDDRRVATAELLEMGAIAPDGGPIRNAVRAAVLRELKEHGKKYGARLHVTAPGMPKGNVDLKLFADNPVTVIKLLHTFNGPSFYLRDRDDPNEEEKQMQHWNAKLLQGTRYWDEVLHSSIKAVNEGADPNHDGALGIVLFGSSGSALVDLLNKTFTSGHSADKYRYYLLDELYYRGWRLRFRGRQIEVLHKGKEEASAIAEAG